MLLAGNPSPIQNTAIPPSADAVCWRIKHSMWVPKTQHTLGIFFPASDPWIHLHILQVSISSDAQGGETNSPTPLFTINFGRAINRKNPLAVSLTATAYIYLHPAYSIGHTAHAYWASLT